MAQLSLPLALAGAQQETFASFWPGDNGLLLAALDQLLTHKPGGYLYLWGRKGSGRSHLLHAACAALSQQSPDQASYPAAYLPLSQHARLTPEMLDGMEHLALICLDDIQAIAGIAPWERAIFNLINRLRALPAFRLVISGDQPPAQLPVQLADLASRLAWGQIYKLHPLDDEGKLKALQQRARLRGFDLPDEVGRFLLSRQSREMRTLCQTLDRLDHASITAQRKLTVPFVKAALGW